MTVIFSCVLALCLGCSSEHGTGFQDRPAVSNAEGVIYFAKEIITLDETRPLAQAVAVSHGKIIQAGSREELLNNEKLIQYAVDDQFEHKVILPGFIEQHLHPLLASMTMNTDAIISIEDWETPHGFSPRALGEEAFRARLVSEAERFDRNINRPMLVWGYHTLFHGPLDRDILDRLVPETPLIVWQRSTHEALLNSAAQQRLNIDQNYIDGWSSELARSQANLETGHFVEAAFWEHILFEKMAPYFLNPEFLLSGLNWTGSYYHKNGITTLVEPAGPVNQSLQTLVARAYGGDDTPFNFYFIPDGRSLALQHFAKGSEVLITETEKMLQWSQGRTQFRPRQVKLLLDGAIYSQLMVMRDGYTDGHHGEWLMTPEHFEDVFLAYWQADYQIHVHYNGDGGLDVLLDTLEAAQQLYPREDHRTVLVHYGFAQADQIKRAAGLGAIASANPVYVTTLAERYAEQGIGRERVENMVPLGDTARAGMSISLHSDMPMAPANPLLLMEAAVNRKTVSGWVPGPSQRITAEEALKAVTLGAAYSVRLDDEIGSITPGKKANFTILEDNPLTVAPDKIADIDVWGTVLEGRVQPVNE
ncbi:MAG: amidohydrolase [Maricaulaceae bacterium]